MTAFGHVVIGEDETIKAPWTCWYDRWGDFMEWVVIVEGFWDGWLDLHFLV